MGDRSGLLWGQFDISTLLRNSRAVTICAERTLSCETSPEKNTEVWFHFDPFHIHDHFFFALLDPFSSLCPFLDFSTCTGLETVGWLPGNHCSSGKNICVFVEWFFFWKSQHLPCKLFVIPSLRFWRIHPVSQYTFSLVTGCCQGRGIMLCDVCQSDVKSADDSFFSFFRTKCLPWMIYWQTTPPPPLLYIIIQ